MDKYDLKVNSDNVGGYFSSEQIDLLSIIQCNNKNQLVNYVMNCDQIKHLYSDFKLDRLRMVDLEQAKRIVFKDYQDSMVLHDSNVNDSIENRLKNIGIREQDFNIIKKALKDRNISFIKQFVQKNYADKIDDILSLNHHFVSEERDQAKDTLLYDELSLLNSQLSYFNTMLIGSGKIYSVVNEFYDVNEPDKRFDFYKAKRDLDFAYNNGKQVRFHSLLVKEDASHLFEGKSKEEVLNIIRSYVKECIDFIIAYNKTHKIVVNGKEVPVIKAIDLFNEIVSFEKNNKGHYYNIWEEKYGISMPELIEAFEYAKQYKPDDVDYLYNEPFLENDERRKKVLEVLQAIESLKPGLIDTLGSQMHITMTIPEENIRRCFNDLKKFQEVSGKKIQITEFDMSLGSQEILRVFGSKPDVSLEQVYDYKKEKVDMISNIINNSGVLLDGISYWSLTDEIDCNLERIRTKFLQQGSISVKEQIPTACGGLIPTHSRLIKKNKINNLLAQEKGEMIDSSYKSSAVFFDQRNQAEVEIAQQIRIKNMAIKMEKEQKRSLKKQNIKKLIKKNPATDSNVVGGGFINNLGLLFIVVFITGVFLMIVYNVIK